MPDRILKVIIPDGEVDGNLIFSVVKDDGSEYDPYYVKLSQISTFVGGGGGGGSSYLKYVALLTQGGTDAPGVDVLENTLGGTVVWTRDSQGYYIGTLAGAFPLNTFMIVGVGQAPEGSLLKFGSNDGANEVYIETFDNTAASVDDILNSSPVEIRVYT